MTSKSLLNICLKVMGVYYGLSALNTLPTSILQTVMFWNAWQYNTQNDPLRFMVNYKIASLVGLFIPILLFFFSLLIIFKSEKISSFLLRREGTINNTHWDILPVTALNISIKILGFFSLLSAIPYVSDLLSNYWIMREDLKLYDLTGKIKLASFGISALLYVCIGLILIFYSSMIADRLVKAEFRKTTEVDTTET
jgi:hypothetical protein